MLIVLVIFGIITTFAILALGSSSAIIERQTIAKEFKVALERARFDSVKRRPTGCADMSRVEITSATSFTYLTDTNRNGTLEPGSESQLVEFGDRSDVAIVFDPEPTYPVIIRFDQRGNTTSGACGSEVTAKTPTIFCQLPCTAATANESNSNGVYVSPTGTVAFLIGGEALPTFSPPTVTNVATNSGINDELAVWTGTPPTPNPSATPSGTVSPTPTPTLPPLPTITPIPLPSVTPIETPTPIPTATPTATPEPSATPLPDCARNERPGDPAACYCRPPMSVSQNGKCQ